MSDPKKTDRHKMLDLFLTEEKFKQFQEHLIDQKKASNAELKNLRENGQLFVKDGQIVGVPDNSGFLSEYEVFFTSLMESDGKYLENVRGKNFSYSLDFTDTSEDVKNIVTRAFAKVSELVAAGSLKEIQEFINGASKTIPKLEIPEQRWTTDRQSRERPHEFILRVWGDGKQLPDWLNRAILRSYDRPLYAALVRQEGHEKPDKRPPEGFHLPTKTEQIDQKLETLEQTGGEGMSFEERERLRRVKNTREHRSQKS